MLNNSKTIIVRSLYFSYHSKPMYHSLSYFRKQLFGKVHLFPILLLAIILHTTYSSFIEGTVYMECEKIEFSEDAESKNKSDNKESKKDKNLDDYLYKQGVFTFNSGKILANKLYSNFITWDIFLPTWTPPPEMV